MKQLMLLVIFSIPALFCVAQQHDQKINIVDSAGTLIAKCTIGTDTVPCAALNPARTITISPEPLDTIQSIRVLDNNSALIPDIHTGIRNPIINGKQNSNLDHVVIIFNSGDTVIIPDIGRHPRLDAVPPPANISEIPDKADCGCDDRSIKEILGNCPDCKDSIFYVYDARCKALYKTNGGDFKRIRNLKDVKFTYKEEFKVKIIHVNRYLKDIAISAEDIEYESQSSRIFNDVFSGTGPMVDRFSDAQGGGDAFQQTINQFKIAISNFIRKFNTLRETRDKIYYQCCEPTKACKDTAGTVTYTELNSEVFELQFRFDSLSAFIKEQITLREKLTQDTADIRKAIATLKKQKKDTTEKTRQLNALIARLANIPPGLEAKKKELESTWALFQKPADDQMRNLIIFNRNFLKENYTFSTSPIFPQGNRMLIKIKIDSQDSIFVFKEKLLLPDHQELQIEGPVRKKWFFSFSSGPFGGFGNDFYPSRYEITRVPSFGTVINDSSYFKIVRAGKSNPPIGLSAFAHFENKTENFGWGVSVGAGLTAETKPRLVYMVGPSAFFGDKNQFGLTVGLAGTQVDAFNKALYPDNQLYKTSPTLSYYKEFKLGGFFALTYTVFTPNNKNKQTAVDPKAVDPKPTPDPKK